MPFLALRLPTHQGEEPKKEFYSPEIKTNFFWEEVSGSVLILKYNTIQSLNVTYIPESSFNANSPSFLIAPPPQSPVNGPLEAVPAPSQSVESSQKLHG
jgi:hypothetical protein